MDRSTKLEYIWTACVGRVLWEGNVLGGYSFKMTKINEDKEVSEPEHVHRMNFNEKPNEQM